MPRVLFLMPTKTYRARAFLAAAEKLDLEIVVGSDRRQALESFTPEKTLTLDFANPGSAVRKIVQFAKSRPLDAVIPVDDDTAVVAAMACETLALPCNPPAAVQATREKHRLRQALQNAGQPVPEFRLFNKNEDYRLYASSLGYPCVLKPVFLSASRGVIRADNPDEFERAFARISKLLSDPEVARRGGAAAELILVERYLPGEEFALEALLTAGALETLAIFDKPEPLEGPYFEETIYVTPSRRSGKEQLAITDAVLRAAEAIGLRHGPVHAEVRLNEAGAWVVEIAARSIGGLCSRSLRFGEEVSLEELLLRHALGQDVTSLQRESQASGVMMIPIARAGKLTQIQKLRDAKKVACIEDIQITIPIGQQVVPLPDGDRYLGFIFARAEKPEQVELAIRQAYELLEFTIE